MQMVELKFIKVVFAEKEKSWNPKNGLLKRATFVSRKIVALQVETHCCVYYRILNGKLCVKGKET